MPSRTDTAGHTKSFDYPVMGHWGKAEMFSSACGTQTDHASVQSQTRYPPPPPSGGLTPCLQLYFDPSSEHLTSPLGRQCRLPHSSGGGAENPGGGGGGGGR